MKKLTMILAAVAMSFMLFSCGDSTKDAIIKEIDNYFVQMEQQLNGITNAEDFLAFVETTSDKSDLLNLLSEKYGDKTVTDEENEAIESFLQEKVIAYNHAEAEKAAEFLTPLIEDYENAVNALYEAFNTEEVDPDTLHVLSENFEKAEVALRPFAEYDNVLPELQQRAQAASAKVEELFNE